MIQKFLPTPATATYLFLVFGFCAAAICAAALYAASQARAAAPDEPILVELFTSQGCSSCPPADRFAATLIKERKDLLVLSLPVDYWDRLGWKDTLASPEFTARQRQYNRKRRWGVYTPQMVVDGQSHGVGSRPQSMLRLISRHKKSRKVKTRVRLEHRGSSVNLQIDASSNIRHAAMIWRVNFLKKRVVDIGAGENSGRRISYHNVVKDIVPLGRWSGAAVKRDLPVSKGYDGVAVFIQQNNHGEVLAANSLTLAQ